jgi:hypothetical protein
MNKQKLSSEKCWPSKKILGEIAVSTFNDSKVHSFFTVPNVENLFDFSYSEFKVFCALRKLTYENKNFLLLTGTVKDGLLKILSKSYSTFKPIQRIINRLKNHGVINIIQAGLFPQITFLEKPSVPSQQPGNATQSATVAPPIYISKEAPKKDKDVNTCPEDLTKSSFILSDQDRPTSTERMNESTIVKTIKPVLDKKYIKALEQLPEFKKYSQDEQATIHRFIHKAKAKSIDPIIIDDYCRSIIFNKTQANMKNTKYRPILNIKNYSHSALFGQMSIYHKLDNPGFPFDIRTQDEINHEQRQREVEEQKTLTQQTLKVIENAQEIFLSKIKYLQDLFKENFDMLLVKAKQTVARLKNYNPLFVPEVEAVEELYNNHNAYTLANTAC